MKINEVLYKPVVTEKATNLAARQIYTFEVNLKANKNKVKEALEILYKVKVGKIRIILRKGKEKKVGRFAKIKKLANKKIAIVEVKEGKIDLFPQS